MTSMKAFGETIGMAEATTKSARRAAKASMRVFEKAIGGAEKVGGEVEKEATEGEVPEAPLKIFEEALPKAEAGAKEKKKPGDSKRDVQSRLDFLARMYMAGKDESVEEEATDGDEMEQD